VGRPTKYNQALGERICERLASGESLARICKDPSMPARSNVFNWLMSESDVYAKFQDRYAKAREIQYQVMADEIMDIADDGKNDYMESEDPQNPGYKINGEAMQRSRLRVDTRKWFMSKVLPKFADKQKVEVSHKVTDDGSNEW